MKSQVLLSGGPFDGAVIEVKAGTGEVWLETLCPSPWAAVSDFADESPQYVARHIGATPFLRVDECSRYIEYRRAGRRDEATGLPVFHAPPDGFVWTYTVKEVMQMQGGLPL